MTKVGTIVRLGRLRILVEQLWNYEHGWLAQPLTEKEAVGVLNEIVEITAALTDHYKVKK